MVRTVNNSCETCSRNNHTRESCRLFGNPIVNNSSTKWQFSQIGKAWQAIGLHEWTLGRHLRGYGLAQYNADIPIPKIQSSTLMSRIRTMSLDSRKFNRSTTHGTLNIERNNRINITAINLMITTRIRTIMPTMKSQIRTTRVSS